MIEQKLFLRLSSIEGTDTYLLQASIQQVIYTTNKTPDTACSTIIL